MINRFNDPENLRARLFLISTKAGSLGINLVGANRCVIFDSSWNPADDVQAIFRIYRFGQSKPVYVYRFVSHGTMEQRIYERQIIKQALSRRVVDDQEIVRHFKENEIAELYRFEPVPTEEKTPAVPKDRLLADILVSEKSRELVVEYHLQDSLLENRPEEELPDAEKEDAWEQYAADRKREEDEERRRQAENEYREKVNAEYARKMHLQSICVPVYDETRGNALFSGPDDLRTFMLDMLQKRVAAVNAALASTSDEATSAQLTSKLNALIAAYENWPTFESAYGNSRKPWKPAPPMASIAPMAGMAGMAQSILRPQTYPGSSSSSSTSQASIQRLLQNFATQPSQFAAQLSQQFGNLGPEQLSMIQSIVNNFTNSQQK